MIEEQVVSDVQNYYGEVLETSADLKTSACCPAEAMPPHLRKLAGEIHPEVIEKFYGCGSPIPFELEGRTVLDLGSGTGRDCFMLSKLVGPKGRVIGVDMTPKQLEVAQRHVAYHTDKFGFDQPNVVFRHGLIEDLSSANLEDASVDVVVSNCVINLSSNKERVFGEIFRVLKPGGELYFSDIFASRRIPEHLAKDPVLLGECLGGAMYIEDFRRMLARLGCNDYRLTTSATLALHDPEIARKAGLINFYSMTIRAFKLNLEDRCEDYGQAARYLGTVPDSEQAFVLDDHHTFEAGKIEAVCANTAAMLSQTRYARHFEIFGEMETHYGLFDCGPEANASEDDAIGACC